MRLLGKLLQGEQLIALGLTEAIRQDIIWVEKAGKYQVSYLQTGELPTRANQDKDLIIFRILQETLNNIIKHSIATNIDIKLEYADQKLQLQVADNGVGFASDNTPTEQGMGLQNIQKRAGIIGGEVQIQSKPQQGTSIAIIIPYP